MSDKSRTTGAANQRPALMRRHDSLAAERDDVKTALAMVADDGEALELRLTAPGVLVATASGEHAPEPWLAASLELTSVVELVTVIIGAKHTGALEVQSQGRWRRLYFNQGAFSGSMSAFEDDRLGSVLWRVGKISLDQLMIATVSVEAGKRIGRSLVDLGYISVGELRPALFDQAEEVFVAACLEEEGTAIFRSGLLHPNPVPFGLETDALVDRVVDLLGECHRLKKKVAPLDAALVARVPAPSGTRTEPEEAIIQLVSSAKEPLTRQDILDKAGLGTMHGLRALASLIEAGVFQPPEPPLKDPTAELQKPIMFRLCMAIDRVMETLDEAGFGLAEETREFARNPPNEELRELLGSFNLDEKLDPEALSLQARFSDGGEDAAQRGLTVLLDFALFQARDCLATEKTEKLLEYVLALGVLN